jgi:hypothetical protein
MRGISGCRASTTGRRGSPRAACVVEPVRAVPHSRWERTGGRPGNGATGAPSGHPADDRGALRAGAQGHANLRRGRFQRAVASRLDQGDRRCPRSPQVPVGLAGQRGMEHAGFNDSYRAVHPDPVKDSGLTWPAARPFVKGYNPGLNGAAAYRGGPPDDDGRFGSGRLS